MFQLVKGFFSQFNINTDACSIISCDNLYVQRMYVRRIEEKYILRSIFTV